MTYIRLLLVGLIAAASIAAADDPPPFGTVVQQWNLQMSGSYAGGGITWRQDSGRLYLLASGLQVYSVTPADPPATERREPWEFANLGGGTADVAWGIAWDPDSGCFWVSQIADGNIFDGSYLLRMAWQDSAWLWRGTPADSWRICSPGDIPMAGMAKWQDLGCFLGAGTAETTGFTKFDPYTKTMLGTIRCDSVAFGIGLVPADSFYIISSGWTPMTFFEWDTTGQMIRSAPSTVYGPVDEEVMVPESPDPQDTVVFYCMCSNASNTLQKISVGLLWGQLKAGQGVAERTPSPAQPAAFRIEPNPCRGSARIRLSSLLPPPYSLSVVDIAGRTVLTRTPNSQEKQITLDLKNLSTGIYVLRLNAGTFACSEKIVLQH